MKKFVWFRTMINSQLDMILALEYIDADAKELVWSYALENPPLVIHRNLISFASGISSSKEKSIKLNNRPFVIRDEYGLWGCHHAALNELYKLAHYSNLARIILSQFVSENNMISLPTPIPIIADNSKNKTIRKKGKYSRSKISPSKYKEYMNYMKTKDISLLSKGVHDIRPYRRFWGNRCNWLVITQEKIYEFFSREKARKMWKTLK